MIFNSFDSDPFGVMKMEGVMDGGDTNDHDRQEKKKNSDIIARVKVRWFNVMLHSEHTQKGLLMYDSLTEMLIYLILSEVTKCSFMYAHCHRRWLQLYSSDCATR